MMKDVLTRMDLATAPVVALLLFFTVFVLVLAFAASRRRAVHFDRMNALPLEDGSVDSWEGIR